MSQNRLDQLIKRLSALNHAIIAFSGGVDSTFLVRVAQLSEIHFLAVTAESPTLPRHDCMRAQDFVATLGIPHRIIKSQELSDKNFTKNPPDRCFYCKDRLFRLLRDIARKEGYRHIIDGSNAEDTNDYRPGLRANKKHEILSPLMELGFGKREIRELSKKLGLQTWDIPSSPCLSSRFPYGVEITLHGIKMVSESEEFLRSLGFRVVRVRTSDSTASIEVGTDELDRLLSPELRRKIVKELRHIGYSSVLIDIEGYKTGKLNREIVFER